MRHMRTKRLGFKIRMATRWAWLHSKISPGYYTSMYHFISVHRMSNKNKMIVALGSFWIQSLYVCMYIYIYIRVYIYTTLNYTHAVERLNNNKSLYETYVLRNKYMLNILNFSYFKLNINEWLVYVYTYIYRIITKYFMTW